MDEKKVDTTYFNEISSNAILFNDVETIPNQLIEKTEEQMSKILDNMHTNKAEISVLLEKLIKKVDKCLEKQNLLSTNIDKINKKLQEFE